MRGLRREVPEEIVGVLVGLEEFLDPLTQRGIASAGSVQIGGALPGGQMQRRAKDSHFAVGGIGHERLG
ncbi:hypothetical protein SBV1_130106 [Verrucomicrobia bacterium]|nr:hypothetical protein SBV1_130106 [Verrucomicrobiota bacterium]